MAAIAAGRGGGATSAPPAAQNTPPSKSFEQTVSNRSSSTSSDNGSSAGASSAGGDARTRNAAVTSARDGPNGSGGNKENGNSGGTGSNGHADTNGAASAAADAIVPGISAATTAARTALESTWSAYQTVTDTADEIAKLNGDGDQVVLSATLESKGKIGFGAKGRYGYDITMQQVGDSQTPGIADDSNVQYDVTFNKNLARRRQLRTARAVCRRRGGAECSQRGQRDHALRDPGRGDGGGAHSTAHGAC